MAAGAGKTHTACSRCATGFPKLMPSARLRSGGQHRTMLCLEMIGRKWGDTVGSGGKTIKRLTISNGIGWNPSIHTQSHRREHSRKQVEGSLAAVKTFGFERNLSFNLRKGASVDYVKYKNRERTSQGAVNTRIRRLEIPGYYDRLRGKLPGHPQKHPRKGGRKREL